MKPFFVQVDINPNLFVKNPGASSLGRKIVKHSVELIDEIGLDDFTFKKLAALIDCSEASVYRYFENKHHLFVYLLNWYWEWMSARIEINTMNIEDASRRLQIALDMIVDSVGQRMQIEFVDETILHRVVVREGAKGYHHKLVDQDNDDGYFLAYKRLCNKISDYISEIEPDFPYPRTLASMLVETANNNIYYAKHLPRLTDIEEAKNNQKINRDVKKMIKYFSLGLINCHRLMKNDGEVSDQ